MADSALALDRALSTIRAFTSRSTPEATAASPAAAASSPAAGDGSSSAVDLVLDAIRTLAGVDRPDVRAALVSCLESAPRVAAIAAEALGVCGRVALDVCIAAVRQPTRTRFAALALAHIGPDGRAAAVLWRALTTADVPTRLTIAAALNRSPRPATSALANWLHDEPDEGVALVAIDLLGRLPPGAVDATTVAHIASIARTAPSPFMRALATWAAAAHGADGLISVAVGLLADPVAGPALVTYVAQRGGPLRPLVDGFPVDSALDPSSALLDDLDPGAHLGRASWLPAHQGQPGHATLSGASLTAAAPRGAQP